MEIWDYGGKGDFGMHQKAISGYTLLCSSVSFEVLTLLPDFLLHITHKLE